MTDQQKIIRDNQTLRSCYSKLRRNDVICSRISMQPGQEPLLTDLVERGVKLIPSGTSQLLSRSKVFQVQLLGEFMVENSLAVYNSHDLLTATTTYQEKQISKVVLKLDRKDGGLGVHLFENIESLYNHVRSGGYPFPFVIQPYISNTRDIRVIIIGEYVEAYERSNPNNFRNNLHCGGKATVFSLSDEQHDFCQKVMQRGSFPYAHLDLILSSDSTFRLMEINLKGGLNGARLTGHGYEEKTDLVHKQLLKTFLNLRETNFSD